MHPTQLTALTHFPRKTNGFGCHPLIAQYWDIHLHHTERPTDEEWAALEKHFNIKTSVNSIYDNADDQIITRLENNDFSAIADWQPVPPNTDHDWFLLTIYDCDDGPSALWAYALS